MAAVVARKDKKRTPPCIREQNLESSLALSRSKVPLSAATAHSSLSAGLLSLKAGDRPTVDYYLCLQVLLKRPICEQRPFPRCPNRMMVPQLLFAEPVTVLLAAAELPAVPELLLRAPPTADSVPWPSPCCWPTWPAPRRLLCSPGKVGSLPAGVLASRPGLILPSHSIFIGGMNTESMGEVA